MQLGFRRSEGVVPHQTLLCRGDRDEVERRNPGIEGQLQKPFVGIVPPTGRHLWNANHS